MKIINTPGGFSLNTALISSLVNGNSVDILNLIEVIDVFESVEAPFISGYMKINDAIKMGSSLPLIGNEILTLNISSGNDEAISGEFFVYKIGNREEISPKIYSYTIFFISIEALYDLNTVHSNAFSGKPNDIVYKMIDTFSPSENKKHYNYEECVNELKFVSQFWHPKKIIAYLCENAINEYGQSDYTFFENRLGFNFHTFDLITRGTQEEGTTYKFLRTDSIPFDMKDNDIDSLYQNINSLVVPESNDYIKNVSNGIYGSLMFAYDMTGQNLIANLYDSREQYQSITHLNPYPVSYPNFMYEPGGCILNKNFAIDTFDDYQDISNTSFIQHRLSRMGMIKNQILNINVLGRTLYTVGKTANVSIYDKIQHQNSPTEAKLQAFDAVFSGNYIVAKLRHHFNIVDNKYTCDIELWKDSLIFDFSQ